MWIECFQSRDQQPCECLKQKKKQTSKIKCLQKKVQPHRLDLGQWSPFHCFWDTDIWLPRCHMKTFYWIELFSNLWKKNFITCTSNSSGSPFIRWPTSHKHLVVLTGWPIACSRKLGTREKKRGRAREKNEGVLRRETRLSVVESLEQAKWPEENDWQRFLSS